MRLPSPVLWGSVAFLGAVGAAVFVALVIEDRGGGTTGPGEGPTPPAVAAPADLEADAQPFEIAFTWSAPGGDEPIDSYRLYRNDMLVQEVSHDATEAVDRNVSPGSSYRYALEALGRNGRTSPRSTIEVRAPEPERSAARLVGIFDVRFRTRSEFGYREFTRRERFQWRFRPTCRKGPCDTRLRDPRGPSLLLERSGRRYSGTTTAPLTTMCGDALVPSTIMVDLEVTRGAAVGKRWHARVIRGTIRNRETARGRCAASGRDQTFVGRRRFR